MNPTGSSLLNRSRDAETRSGIRDARCESRITHPASRNLYLGTRIWHRQGSLITLQFHVDPRAEQKCVVGDEVSADQLEAAPPRRDLRAGSSSPSETTGAATVSCRHGAARSAPRPEGVSPLAIPGFPAGVECSASMRILNCDFRFLKPDLERGRLREVGFIGYWKSRGEPMACFLTPCRQEPSRTAGRAPHGRYHHVADALPSWNDGAAKKSIVRDIPNLASRIALFHLVSRIPDLVPAL